MSGNAFGIELLPMESLAHAAACLKVMAHPVRLRIVDILTQEAVTVKEIAELCDTKEHQVCEHLRLMQNCGLLSSKRQGRAVYYAIASDQLPALLNCVRQHCGVNGAKS